MSFATRSISLIIIITNIITSCKHVKVMIRDRIFTRGGDIFLGNPLWGENLSLGYSLLRRKFPGRGTVL